MEGTASTIIKVKTWIPAALSKSCRHHRPLWHERPIQHSNMKAVEQMDLRQTVFIRPAQSGGTNPFFLGLAGVVYTADCISIQCVAHSVHSISFMRPQLVHRLRGYLARCTNGKPDCISSSFLQKGSGTPSFLFHSRGAAFWQPGNKLSVTKIEEMNVS